MSKLTPIVIGAFVLILVGFILSVVGIFSPGWIKNQGLFQACFGECISIDLSEMESFYKATAAMEILAFLASIVCLAGAVVYLVLGQMGSTSGILALAPMVVLISSIVEGFFAIIGCIIFAAKLYDKLDPDYSFFLTIIGAIILIIGSAVLFKQKNNSQIGGV